MLANWVHVMIVHLAVIGTPWLVYRVITQRKLALDSKPWKANYSILLIFNNAVIIIRIKSFVKRK